MTTVHRSGYLRAPLAVAAIAPTSTSLATAVSSTIPTDGAPTIVELGPGTGSFPARLSIVWPGRPPPCHRDQPRFAHQLAAELPQVYHRRRRVAESTHAPNKRTGPGPTNWALAAALSAMMLALAVLRTTTLADSAARRAVATAIATTVDVPDAGMLTAIERTAWWSAFWPDVTFTVTLMTMLALLALLIGYHSPIRHQALSLHLARHNATRARAKAARARAAADHAARQADAQLHAATARRSHATALTTALTDRFTRAKHLARHLITENQATPDSTTTIFPPDNSNDAHRENSAWTHVRGGVFSCAITQPNAK